MEHWCLLFQAIMKVYCVVFLSAVAVCAQAMSPELTEKVNKITKECLAETGADEALVHKLNHGEYEGSFEDLKCFPKCFFLKAGFMDDQGELIDAKMKEEIKGEAEHEKLAEIIDECKEQTGKDICEKAFLNYKCYHEHVLAAFGKHHHE